jgi:uncharacterized repeat protein (TIGR01451 family)
MLQKEKSWVKISKTGFIVSLLLLSMLIGVIPAARAGNLDSFGYAYKDNNTPGGPAYNWIEISETGTKAIGDSGIDFVNNINFGFDFSFYSNSLNQISIGVNGLLFLGTWQPQYRNNVPITNTTDFHGIIAPYWDALSPLSDSNSGVYYETKGVSPNRMFIVEWYKMMAPINMTFGGDGITFEAILYESSNNILFQYQNVEFGTSFFNWLVNNGASATVGIEDPTGTVGLEYSYNEPAISSGLAILLEYPTLVTLTNLYVSINAPSNMDKGELMTLTVSYCNLGGTPASNAILSATIPPEVSFVSASDDPVYDPIGRTVTWNINSVDEYPSGYGTQTVTVQIPSDTLLGTLLQGSANIVSSADETTYDDNVAFVQTQVTGLNLPENVGIDASQITSDPAHTPIVTNREPITFTYNDPSAIGVDISIHLSDGQPDVGGVMTGPDPEWTYTLTFGARSGDATATFTVHHPTDDVTVTANIEVVRVDPAGYIYDVSTGERVPGATVWLQMPNGRGGWTNVPTGEEPAIMDPDVNPQTTGANGRYQWDTLAGTYRVHVEASGYYPADSITVSVPPPVTDLHVGLVSFIDDPPPITTLYIGTPKQTGSNGKTQVASSTQFTLTAKDNTGGSGVASTKYQISNSEYNSGWIISSPPTVFQLSGLPDGDYTIAYFSIDYGGNFEVTKTKEVTLVDEENGENLINLNSPILMQEPSIEGCSATATATFSASLGDAGAPYTCTVEYGDGTGISPGIVSGYSCMGAAHTYLDNGHYVVTIWVTDRTGASATSSSIHVVNNEPSVVGLVTAPINPIQIGSAMGASANFVDEGILDTHTATWSWGDGSTSPGTVSEVGGSGSVTGTHTYAEAGVYTVSVTVVDKDGGSGQSISQNFVVVYDPNAGFVTGGGWINSPSGSYVANPALTGKATFGFVSKYQKGATIPTGNTEFVFQVVGLKFQSTSYDWLVVAGTKAQYKGLGTINGIGNYAFMLTADDGGNKGQDTFRIRIWDANTDLVVYDNGAQRPLGGGSIIVHK